MSVQEDNNTIFVVKRDGRREKLDISKIRKQTEEACEGLDGVSFEELEFNSKLMFQDGINSSYIQEALISTALRLNCMEAPNWIYVAGRLSLYDLYHNIKHTYNRTGSGCVYKAVTLKDYISKYSHTLSDFYKTYTDEEIELFNSKIDPSRDKLFAYPAVKLLLSHYLNRTSTSENEDIVDLSKQIIIELPQHMFMTIAMFNAQNMKENRVETVLEFYDLMSNQYLIPATPQLANGRVKSGGLASCLVLSMDDDLDNIMSRFTAVSKGSKLGAGFGIDITRIRSYSAPINKIAGASGGKIPLCKTLDSLANYINQGGKRPGAFAITIAIWDSEVSDFIDLKKKQGDDRRRGHSIYTALAVDDVFMSRVTDYLNGNTEVEYTLFNPYDVRDLCDTFGEDFKFRYLNYEKRFEEDPSSFCPGTMKVKVKEILGKVVSSIADTGFPYWTFIDTVNNNNPHPEFGPIRCGNLCVHGDTRVLTSTGYKRIRDLLNISTMAWNGVSFEPTFFFEAGEANGYIVEFNNAPSIVATEEHKFHVKLDKSEIIKTTKELRKGMKLIDFKAPDIVTNLEEVQSVVSSLVTKVRTVLLKDGAIYSFFTRSLSDSEELVIKLQEVGINSRIERVSSSIYMVYTNREGILRAIDNALHQDLLHFGEIGTGAKTEYIIYSEDKELPPVEVQSIRPYGSKFISYCGKESKKERLFFNGVITGNCQEVMLPADRDEIAVCNLGSINVARVNGDYELLARVTRAVTRFLDNAIDITEYPHPDAEKTQKKQRALGIGVLGEAEFVANSKVEFGSPEHIELIDKIYGTINKVSYETSVQLAKELGPCDTTDKLVRNAYRMCIAPNTQTGIFASTTSGCEPVYGIEWIEDSGKAGTIKLTAPHLNIENYPYYKDGFTIDPYKLVDACAARQKHIDMSITFSFFLKTVGLSAKQVVKYYHYAWSKGLKAIYYLRSEGVKQTVKTECESCAN